jgi:hypothetical protein
LRVPVQILDLSSGAFVDAELFDEVTLDHFVETQRDWRPMVVDATKSMIKRGVDPKNQPRHWHWNWEIKVPQLQQFGLSFYGIEYAGQLQGLMKIDLAKHAARITTQAGEGLAYIDYLEVAPWNLREITSELGQKQRFGVVGFNLYAAAVLLSQQAGFEGRVGLHSLPHPKTEQFYQKTCRMMPLERDPKKEDLLYFETTPELAELFLTEAKR